MCEFRAARYVGCGHLVPVQPLRCSLAIRRFGTLSAERCIPFTGNDYDLPHVVAPSDDNRLGTCNFCNGTMSMNYAGFRRFCTMTRDLYLRAGGHALSLGQIRPPLTPDPHRPTRAAPPQRREESRGYDIRHDLGRQADIQSRSRSYGDSDSDSGDSGGSQNRTIPYGEIWWMPSRTLSRSASPICTNDACVCRNRRGSNCAEGPERAGLETRPPATPDTVNVGGGVEDGGGVGGVGGVIEVGDVGGVGGVEGGGGVGGVGDVGSGAEQSHSTYRVVELPLTRRVDDSPRSAAA